MSDETRPDESITLFLSREVYDALKEIADRRGVEIGEALKEAVGSDLFILREAANGSKILIKRPDASMQELVISAH